MRPHDLPPAERFQHGTRARYVCGCRCDACRASNTAYARGRAERAKAIAAAHAPRRSSGTCPGIFRRRCGTKLYKNSVGGRCAECRAALAADELVNVGHARLHLRELSDKGVGYKSVGAACDVGKSTLFDILTGRTLVARKSTVEKILAVDATALADAALVDAAPTWRRIDELLALGFTKAELARRLGYARGAIQFRRDQVLARTELRVRRLRDELVRVAKGRAA